MALMTPSIIEHTLIGALVTKEQVLAHARECVTYGFGSAMVQGSWVDVVAEELAGSGIPVASALDFPEVGLMTSAGKAAEAAELVRRGAEQIDIGVQIGWLKSGMTSEYRDDIGRVVEAAGVPIKVMLELPILTEYERKLAVDLAVDAGVSYVKNASSGAVEVASVESIAFLRERAPATVGVKASGGIKSRDHVEALLAAGADMVGTSAGVSILEGSITQEALSY